MAENKNDSAKKKIELQRAKDKEKVRGRFRFHEVPGGILEFVYKAYKGDPVLEYKVSLGTELRDGEVYELPLGVARHLNSSGRIPENMHALDANGKNTVKLKRMVARYGFEPLDFTPVEEVGEPDTSPLYTIEPK